MHSLDYYLERLYTKLQNFLRDSEKQKKFMSIIFIVLVGGLLIQGALVMNIFTNSTSIPKKPVNQKVLIIQPAYVLLNKPFSISFEHLMLNTTYQINFMDINFTYQAQKLFNSNSSTTFTTKLTALSQYNFNNTLKLNILNYQTAQIESFAVIPFQNQV